MNQLLAVNSIKLFSLNGTTNALMLTFFFDGGRREVMHIFPTTRSPIMRNATLRIAQPKPMVGMRWVTIMGMITPPTEDPETIIPRARARWVVKNGDTAAIAGGNGVSFGF
jgi:hypothetical protein